MCVILQWVLQAQLTISDDRSGFLLDNKPLTIRSGEIHPQRIAEEFWETRVLQARNMGLNTITVSVMYNYIYMRNGVYNFTGRNNIGLFIYYCRKYNMHVILRPGLYVGNNADLGGIDSSLLARRHTALRTSYDDEYNNTYTHYTKQLIYHLKTFSTDTDERELYNIIMIELEHEYLSWPPGHTDYNYITGIKNMWSDYQMVFYITYSHNSMLRYLAYTNSTNNSEMEELMRVLSSNGTAIGLAGAMSRNDIEIFRDNLTYYGIENVVFVSYFAASQTGYWGQPRSKVYVKNVTNYIRQYLENQNCYISFSLYTLHDGTNFELMAGADIIDGRFCAATTVSNYGSAISEAGKTTKLYNSLKKTIFYYINGTTPQQKIRAPEMDGGLILALDYITNLSNTTSQTHFSEHPQPIESFNQRQGFIYYESTVYTNKMEEQYLCFNYSDIATLTINNQTYGPFYRTDGLSTGRVVYKIAMNSNTTIQILVEALGHVSANYAMQRDLKGVLGPVQLGKDDNCNNSNVTGWKTRLFPVTAPPAAIDAAHMSVYTAYAELYRPGGLNGTFVMPIGLTRGYIWVNDALLGRYWDAGPYQSLYCPASLIRDRIARITVLDMSAAREEAMVRLSREGDDEEDSTVVAALVTGGALLLGAAVVLIVYYQVVVKRG